MCVCAWGCRVELALRCVPSPLLNPCLPPAPPRPLPPLLLQKASSVIGSRTESEAQRGARLYGLLQDFGEMDLVVR